MKKISPARATFWFLAVATTLFVCHASCRLLDASKNQRYFYFHEGLATFSELGLHAFYLRMPTAYSACINRLRQIDGATQQWALENKKNPDDKVTWKDILPYLRNEQLQCPDGGIYVFGKVSDAPRCTIRDHKLPE